jgi:hypothetical protein
MKKHLFALMLEVVFTAFAAVAFAQQADAPPAKGSGLPPPGINDPGPKQSSIPLPSTSIPPSIAPAARGDNGDQAPTVSVHTESNGDTVEEYRRGATLYMVRITPKNGVTQTFMVNGGTGKLIRDPRMGPVDPVYYTIYKWGAPPKPASSSD